MLKPEVIGSSRSTYTRVVRMVCEENGIDYALTEAELGAREVSSHVVFLHQGKVDEEGAPDEIFCAPKSDRLLQFPSSAR